MCESNGSKCCCCAYLSPPWWLTMGFVPGGTAQPTTVVKPAISTLNIKPSDAALSEVATEKAIMAAEKEALTAATAAATPTSDQSSGDLSSRLGAAGTTAAESVLNPVWGLVHLL